MTDIHKKIDDWRRQLLDLSKRNKLVNCKIGSRGALQIVHPSSEQIWQSIAVTNGGAAFPWKRDLVPGFEPEDDDNDEAETSKKRRPKQPPLGDCLSSPGLQPNYSLTELDDKALDRRLGRLSINARTRLSEQGVNDLFLAFGLLRWCESVDSEEFIESPLVLIPVELFQEHADAPWLLTLYEEEVAPNHSLIQSLHEQFKLQLPNPSDHDLLESVASFQDYLKQVESVIASQERWEIRDVTLLGNFSFPKIAMWQDLDENREQVSSHDLCRAIAGDTTAPVSASSDDMPSPADFDAKIPPHDVHSILDCDGSQFEAVVAAKHGISFVLDGPPGTGKSQTIANIIAEFLANDKTVLFVSEKAAALEVVKRRLDGRNLGDFCLECHSHKANKREVIKELGRCLSLKGEQYTDQKQTLDDLFRARQKLNDYIAATHHRVDPLGIAPFEAHGELAALSHAPQISIDIPRVNDRDGRWVQDAIDTLGRLKSCESVLTEAAHPWRSCKTDRFSLSLVDDLKIMLADLAVRLDSVREKHEEVHQFGFGCPHPSIQTVADTLNQARSALSTQHIPASWFESKPREVAKAIVRVREADSARSRLRETISGFVPNAHLNFDGGFEAQFLDIVQTSNMLKESQKDTLRQRVAKADSAIQLIEKVKQTSGVLQQAMTELATSLTVNLGADTKIKSLPKLCALATEIGRAPTLKKSWFNPHYQQELLNAAEGQKSADEGSAEVYSLFRRDAHADVKPQIVAELIEDDQVVEFNSNNGIQSVREIATKLRDVRLIIRELLQSASDLRSQVATLVGHFSLQASVPLTFRQIEAVASSSETVARYGGVGADWLDSRTRDELTTVAKGAAQDFDRIDQLRQELSSKLGPRAFESDGDNLATRAQSFRSFWSRLFSSRWRKFRDDVVDVYVDDVPSRSGELLRQLQQLRQYHRRLRNISEYEKRLGEFTIPPARRNSDWKLLIEALEAFDNVCTTLGLMEGDSGFSDRIRTGDLAGVARGTAGGVERIRRCIGETRSQPARDLINRQIGSVEARPIEDLQLIIGELSEWVDDKLKVATRIEGTLLPGKDIPLTDLERFSRIFEYVGASRQLSEEVEEKFAGDIIRKPDGKCDWERMAEGVSAAQRIGNILRLPESLIQNLCTEGTVDRVRLADLSKTLSDCLGSLRGEVSSASSVIDLGLGDDPAAYENLSAPALTDQVNNLQTKLSHHQAVADRFADQLRDGEDVPFDDVPHKFAALREFGESAATIQATVDAFSAVSKFFELEDIEKNAKRAEWLLTFLDQHNDSPPDAIVRIVTDHARREDLHRKANELQKAIEDELSEGERKLAKLFPLDRSVSDSIIFNQATLDETRAWVDRRQGDVERVEEWTTYEEVKSTLKEMGLGDFLSAVEKGNVASGEVVDAFRQRFYRKWLDGVYHQSPLLRKFDVNEHEELIQRFKQLDRDSILGAYKRIRSTLLQHEDRPQESSLASSSELGILTRQVNLKRRHLALRSLFAKTPTILSRLKPCVMMSPLAVSTYLNSEDLRFDLVIFDEASQVRPFDAIGAIYRGAQLIVAGDQKQLPPTNFFDRSYNDDGAAESEEDDGGDISDFESILDVCISIGMPRRRLRWHYRSQRESLIAFSNRHYYDNELVTFPSVHDVAGNSAVTHDYVEDGVWSGQVNQIEAERVVDLIANHMKINEGRSLGVITFNQRQQLLVYDLLHELRQRDRRLDDLMVASEQTDEPFFIKNLETVQGDERDCIFLSMGYGYDSNHNFYKRFGPLNRKGGERRLNVAVTRAKHSLTLVSSVRAGDMDLSATGSVGPRLLKNYLEYAEKGVATLGREVTEENERSFDSPFEREVAKALEAEGFKYATQVGCGGFRIDLGLYHPERHGQFTLGIECDGATYHSSKLARDRDRLRQDVLENLGWSICRIWSTDWVRNPSRQVARVKAAFEEALTRPEKNGSLRGREPGTVEIEEPIVIERGPDATVRVDSGQFETIGDVPDKTGIEAMVTVLRKHGAMDEDDLIRCCAREFGFKRTGTIIRRTIQLWIKSGVDQRHFSLNGDGKYVFQAKRETTEP